MARQAQAETAGPEAWLEEGLALHAAGDRPGAEALFLRAAETRPDDPTGLYLLALSRFEAGDSDSSERLLERVTELRPQHLQARLTLANLRQWRGENAAAAAAYGQAVALDPARPDALIGLCQTLMAAGDAEGAAAAGQAAAAAAPGDPAAQLALAAALLGAGRIEGAVAAYRASVALKPGDAAARAGLALALLQAGDGGGALKAAAQAAERDPASAEAWFALGLVCRSVGRPAIAAPALRRSLALDPTRAGAHLSLGAALVELDDFPGAEFALRRAVELDPACAEAHANLSSLYLRGERFSQARAHAERALVLDPRMWVAHRNLAGLCAREGQAEAARRHRDLGYGVANLQVLSAAQPVQRVLVLTTTESGNVPERHLLPADRYTRINWFVEYARAEQFEALPPYDVVFNAIGDPDLSAPTARNVARFLEVCRRPFFNRPDRIERTARRLAGALFAGVPGLVVPKVAKIDAQTLADRGLMAAADEAGVTPPLLVRPIGSHGGQGLILVSEAAEAAAVPAGDCYVTAFHDYRSPDGLWRKHRVIFVDRRPYPYHLAIGKDWMVHYETSGTGTDPARIAEERRFLEDAEQAVGASAMAAVREIGARMDLDFCGVDFGVLADGRALLFEANATMLVHPESPDGPLAHKNPFVERILGAFQAMLAARTAG
ncbi:MAG: tetratricopeptide repeat protein [Caulobacteraceae bacterium]|nr:tetratricopeptide repeat protein [Caulobacteraceae bacterium]